MTALIAVLLGALPVAADVPFEEKLEKSIHKKLGRPYVWGGTGLKTYDCSGFVWRCFRDAGIFFKRTTVSRMFYCFRAPTGGEESELGTLVFFNRLRHVAIVRNQAQFYHASSSKGTVRDNFKPYWQPRVCGYRVVFSRPPASPARGSKSGGTAP